MICRLRAAGYSAGATRGLPAPSYDESGFVNEEYWQELVNLNVPRTVLDFVFPSIRSAGGTETRTGNGSGVDTGLDDVRAYARSAGYRRYQLHAASSRGRPSCRYILGQVRLVGTTYAEPQLAYSYRGAATTPPGIRYKILSEGVLEMPKM